VNEKLHHDVWEALRRVERGEAPGSSELREMLFRHKLAEWIPGERGVRLTARGEAVLRTR
jgi:hypothetical protein